MYGHSPIYDWQDFKTGDLKKALDLMKQLEELGFWSFPDEMKLSIRQELQEREKEVKVKNSAVDEIADM